MSDYVRNKQVLYPVTKELLDRLNISNIFDLDFPRGSKFDAVLLTIAAQKTTINTWLMKLIVIMELKAVNLAEPDF